MKIRFNSVTFGVVMWTIAISCSWAGYYLWTYVVPYMN